MKLVKCIVRSYKLDETADALKAIDVPGLTVTQAVGRGSECHRMVWYRGVPYEARFTPQMILEAVVAECLVDDVVRVVMETARTGQRGDGRVFVLPVDEAYTIRTRAGGSD